VQIIGRALRVAGGAEDEAGLVLQYGQPAPDIGGVIVAHLRRDTEISRQERRAEFRNQLFARVAFVAEALAPEIPRQALLMLGPVDAFMRELGIPTKAATYYNLIAARLPI
jgi:hypothetical protein